jgi:hypothetical protein
MLQILGIFNRRPCIPDKVAPLIPSFDDALGVFVSKLPLTRLMVLLGRHWCKGFSAEAFARQLL